VPLDDAAVAAGGGSEIEAPTDAAQGEAVTVNVGPEFAGDWVSTWAHSDPTQLGANWVQVGADGTISTIIGSNLPVGQHDLVVQLADNELLGSSTIQIAAAGEALSSTPTPKVSGTAKVGSKLTAKPGTWGPSGVTLSYQWLADGTPIPGGAKSTFTVQPGQYGKKISVSVTGSASGFAASTRSSAVTAKVAKGTLKAPTPKVAGTRKVGRILTANAGKWSPVSTGLTYQWLRNGKAIKGQKSKQYTLTSADKGKYVTVKVTGACVGYSKLSKTSARVKTA
jgi:hypothetical protein